MERRVGMKETSENRYNFSEADIRQNSRYETSNNSIQERDKLKNDKMNILILFFLYILQGIPLGLAGSIPMILQNRNVSYKEQAIFSFVSWPFSVKLLWAPVVDSLYWKKLGRRKTWLIPTQYLIGLFMLFLSYSISSVLGNADETPNVLLLTVIFFIMNFLAATQDIAVDGWALTMLSRQNVGYASTCNSVGQTAGFFLGNVVFLALESADFCNKYLRSIPQDEGIVTLSSFLKFWGIVFFITTSLVLIFKKEAEGACETFSIKDAYSMLYRILCLRNIWLIVSFLLTCKVAFAATDSVTGLKLVEAGVQKEHIALLAVPLVPLQILLPLLISRYTAGPKPLSVFLLAYPFRLIFGPILAFLVWWTYQAKLESGGFPYYYYIVIVIFYALHQVTVYSVFVALMAFFAKVSDPSIGGTYMTLLNTMCNLGGNWPATLALWFVDPLTSKRCGNSSVLSCDTKELASKCTEAGLQCEITVDGYYVETVLCFIIGFLWLKWGRSTVRRLQQMPLSAWKCPR